MATLHAGRTRSGRTGFTLIELLVVIAIIAILMGLAVAAAMRVRHAADRGRVQAELGGLQVAASNFKNSVGTYPLVSISRSKTYTLGKFRLATSYQDASGQPLTEVVEYIDPADGQTKLRTRNWPEVDFLMLAFPNMSRADNGLRVVPDPADPTQRIGDYDNGQPVPPANPILLDGNEALVFFLSGGLPTNFKGFSMNSQKPFTPVRPLKPGESPEARKGPFLDVQAAKFRNRAGVTDGRMRDPWGTPYAVFGYAAHARGYPDIAFDNPDAPGNTVKAYYAATGPFNATGLQVISAGADRRFGPGSAGPQDFYAGGTKAWTAAQPGGDDQASFRRFPLSAPDE